MTEYTTQRSVPVTVSNVIDPIAVVAKFVYNFYVSNEDKEYSPDRTTPVDYNMGLVSQDTVNSIESKARGSLAARVPRYISISIIPSASEQEWDVTPVVTPQILDKLRTAGGSANIRNINLEGEIQNKYVANPALVDAAVKNRIQREVYSASEAILQGGGIFGDMSDEMIAKNLNLSLSDDIDEAIILDSLSDTEEKGYKFSNEIVSNRYSRILTRSEIQHRLSFNAGSFRNILSPLCKSNPFSAYFEIDSLGNSAASAGLGRNLLLDETQFPTISESDPDENKVPSIVWLLQRGDSASPSQFSEICQGYPKINHIGYIVEKNSVSPAGRYETHSPHILINRSVTEFIDPNIKYGYTYFYRARQLYLTDIVQISSVSSTEIEYRILTCAIASSAPPAVKVIARENDIPNPPAVLVPEYVYDTKSLRLEWAHPTNPSRDIKKYQVFRRKNLNSAFELITEYDFTDSEYTGFRQLEVVDSTLIKKIKYPVSYHIDKEFDSSSSFIYCIASVDAHGLCSSYGTQIQVTFNIGKNNIETRIVSRSGAPRAYPNYYIDPTELEEFGSDRLIEDVIKDSGHGTLRIHFNPDAYKFQSDSISSTESVPIVLSRDSGTYKMQIINLDRQISKTLEASVIADPALAGLM